MLRALWSVLEKKPGKDMLKIIEYKPKKKRYRLFVLQSPLSRITIHVATKHYRHDPIKHTPPAGCEARIRYRMSFHQC